MDVLGQFCSRFRSTSRHRPDLSWVTHRNAHPKGQEPKNAIHILYIYHNISKLFKTTEKLTHTTMIPQDLLWPQCIELFQGSVLCTHAKDSGKRTSTLQNGAAQEKHLLRSAGCGWRMSTLKALASSRSSTDASARRFKNLPEVSGTVQRFSTWGCYMLPWNAKNICDFFFIYHLKISYILLFRIFLDFSRFF